jgi:hypothetical protein
MTEEEKVKNEKRYARDRVIYNDLKSRGLILFETVIGSQAHGTAIETSDVDKGFVFCAPQEWLMFHQELYQQELRLSPDYVGKEIGSFILQAQSNNPTILEFLFTPKDCYISNSSAFQRLLNVKEQFITKVAEKAFAGYASQQLSKAKGQEKMQNWEKNRVLRKTPMDFCWVTYGQGSLKLHKYLEVQNLMQERIGLVNIPHMKGMYSMFYDCEGDIGYRGIYKEGAADVRVSSIEKDVLPIATMLYDKDAYSTHCKDYKRYQDWVDNRNEARWVEVKGHDQKIDGKNILHLVRLIQIAEEISEGKGINIRRHNAEELISIRRGERDLESIAEWGEVKIGEMKANFQLSDLPDAVPNKLVIDLVENIRNDVYMGMNENYSFEDTNEFLKLEK